MPTQKTNIRLTPKEVERVFAVEGIQLSAQDRDFIGQLRDQDMSAAERRQQILDHVMRTRKA